MGIDQGSVVVVEDDPSIADLIALYLGEAGYRVHLATDGERGVALTRSLGPRLVVLDLGLPGRIDGLDVCRDLRRSSDVPIIVVTARDAEIDRVLGFELGADDYLTKPFSPRELVARVKAVLRRTSGPVPARSKLVAGGVEVDVARREATLDGAPVPLTGREFDLLAHLAAHPGLALSRRQLVDSVWGDDWVGDDRTVDVHVRQLRRKLGDALPLATVWGVGYRLS